MSKKFLVDAFGWGFALWFVGYVLGIAFFMVLPPALIGWVITPIGVIMTLWVLLKRVKATSLQYVLALAAIWTLIAILCDYFFLVRVFKPSDGYYKFDVYLYYFLTLFLPLLAFWMRTKKHSR